MWPPKAVQLLYVEIYLIAFSNHRPLTASPFGLSLVPPLIIWFSSVRVLHHFAGFVLELLPYLKYRMPFWTCPIHTKEVLLYFLIRSTALYLNIFLLALCSLTLIRCTMVILVCFLCVHCLGAPCRTYHEKLNIEHWVMSLLLSKKKQQLGVKNLWEKLTICWDGPIKSTKTRQGWKHKKTTLLQKNGGNIQKKDKKTTLHLLHNIVICYSCTVVFLSFFSTIFCSRVVFLCFHPCFVSAPFMGLSLHVHVVKITKTFLLVKETQTTNQEPLQSRSGARGVDKQHCGWLDHFHTHVIFHSSINSKLWFKFQKIDW